MSPAIAANAIVALAVLTGLVCLFYGPWQSICTDLTRQVIFERRDRLFDLALAGRLDFDSDGYRAARHTLNGMLRFAHELTWPDMVIGLYFVQTRKLNTSRWRETLETIPAEVRDEVDELVKECSAILTGMMALKSLFLAPILAIACIVLVCTSGLSWLLRCVAAQKKFEPLNETIQAATAEFAESEMAMAA